MPPGATASAASWTSETTPVHSTTMSGCSPRSATVPVWYVRAQLLDQRRLRTGRDPVEHVDLDAVLHADQRGQQPDGAGADDQHRARVPERPLADGQDLLPRLGDDGRRFQEDAQEFRGSCRPGPRTPARSATART